MYELNLNTMTWSLIVMQPDIPPRSGFTFHVVKHNSEQALFIFGGEKQEPYEAAYNDAYICRRGKIFGQKQQDPVADAFEDVLDDVIVFQQSSAMVQLWLTSLYQQRNAGTFKFDETRGAHIFIAQQHRKLMQCDFDFLSGAEKETILQIIYCQPVVLPPTIQLNQFLSMCQSVRTF